MNVDELESISIYKELGDYKGSLEDLKMKVEELINKYGKDSLIIFDAGYNNVDCRLITEEKIKENELVKVSIDSDYPNEKEMNEILKLKVPKLIKVTKSLL